MNYSKKDFSHYTYEVGRYEPEFGDNKKTFKPYKPDNSHLIWNVFDYDFNSHKMRVANIFECNWVFLRDGLLYAKKHYNKDFKKFAHHVRRWLQHEYWARAEYEMIISGWPGKGFTEKDLKEALEEIKDQKKKEYTYPSVELFDKSSEKIDMYTQIMMNWDKFIDYVWNNRRLITAKKLGLTK